MPTQLQALKVFADIEQNPDLLRLESLLKRFNLFEAIGVIKQELRHSDLLAALLDPSQRHGLETVFLRELLRDVLLAAGGGNAVTQNDLNLWNLDQVKVLREWHYIDIRVLDEINHFAVIIENKIDTVQGLDQLERYYEDFISLYPGYKVIALYLTRDGHAPNDDRYLSLSYAQVCQVIEKIVQQHRDILEADTVVLLEHYAMMLRRHILSDSGVAELCQSIYQTHKQALDTIFEHRPDQQAQINERAKLLIRNETSIKSCYSKKDYIQFNPLAWDGSPLYRGVYPSCPWFLYFQFSSEPNNLSIELLMTPADQEHRKKLYEIARQNAFQGCPPQLTRLRGRGGWCRLFEKIVLTDKDYEKTQEEIEAIMSQKWAEFLRDDLNQITQAIRDEKWLWESL